MKTTLIIIPIAILGLFSFSFISLNSDITIADALKEKKIEVSVLPYGSYCADNIRIKVKNLTNHTINLDIPKGTIFIPDDNGEQTLTTSEDELFAVEKNEEKPVAFHGFCTELHDHGSHVGSTFKMGQTENQKLIKLLAYMDSLKIKAENTVQHSIWCITDNAPVANAYYSQDPKVSKALNDYLCNVTGQKHTWYNVNSEITFTPAREIVLVSKDIKGELAFTATERVELQGVVKDSLGNVKYLNPHKTTCPPGHIRFDFQLQVQGWPQGNYSVVYTNNGVEVINQKFTL